MSEKGSPKFTERFIARLKGASPDETKNVKKLDTTPSLNPGVNEQKPLVGSPPLEKILILIPPGH